MQSAVKRKHKNCDSQQRITTLQGVGTDRINAQVVIYNLLNKKWTQLTQIRVNFWNFKFDWGGIDLPTDVKYVYKYLIFRYLVYIYFSSFNYRFKKHNNKVCIFIEYLWAPYLPDQHHDHFLDWLDKSALPTLIRVDKFRLV